MVEECPIPFEQIPVYLRGHESALDRQFHLMKGLKDFSPTILDRHIMVAGAGGNGCHVALSLVRMGFREITMVDKDLVDPSNLTRQVLYTKKDIGRRKAEVALEALERNNLCSSINAQHLDILQDRKEFGGMVKESDFVFDLLDTFSARVFVSNACLHHGKPMVTGGTDASSGIVTDIQIQRPEGKPCLYCNLFPFKPPTEWIEFCRYKEEPFVLLDEEKKRRIYKVDSRHSFPHAASFYLIASLGSTLMVSAMLKYLMGHDFPNRYLFNIYTFNLFSYQMKARRDCEFCGEDL